MYVTHSMIAFYDVHCIPYLYLEKSGDGQRYYIERRLESGLRILVRNDGYFIFDFEDAPFGCPEVVKIENISSLGVFTLSQRMETIHAFLACVKTQLKVLKRVVDATDKEPVCNYIECSNSNYDLDEILEKNDINQFSSLTYLKAAQSVLKVRKNITFELDEKFLNASIHMLDAVLLKDNDPMWCYSLGLLYRSVVYLKSNLFMDCVKYAKSVLEWLAKKAFPDATAKARYENLLQKHNIESKEREKLLHMKNLRDDAFHDLKFPDDGNAVSVGVEIVLRLHNLESGFNIFLPISTSRYHILTER